MTIDGINVIVDGFQDMTKDEIRKYIDYLGDKVPDPITDLTIRAENDGRVGLLYTFNSVKFERIRRITGYLVGTIDRWNNAKKSEERERVKHDVRRNSD